MEARCGECLKKIQDPGDIDVVRDGMVTYTIHRGICARLFEERLRTQMRVTTSSTTARLRGGVV
jgi:hypothetical protein